MGDTRRMYRGAIKGRHIAAGARSGETTMSCPLKAVAWTIIDGFGIPSPVPADVTAANDNDDERFDILVQDIVVSLLGDGLKMLAG
jgi:hypothetical protein